LYNDFCHGNEQNKQGSEKAELDYHFYFNRIAVRGNDSAVNQFLTNLSRGQFYVIVCKI
jgi:hypothetical protein